MPINACRRCGGEVVQKSRTRLVVVGGVLIVAALLSAVWPILWAAALLTGLTGAYLLMWVAIGRGRWCRGCKRFDGL
jgi:hypothetical protein